MSPIRATFFNAAGLPWCEAVAGIDAMSRMLAPDDIGWMAGAHRWTATGGANSLALLGPYAVDPVTLEITLQDD